MQVTLRMFSYYENRIHQMFLCQVIITSFGLIFCLLSLHGRHSYIGLIEIQLTQILVAS